MPDGANERFRYLIEQGQTGFSVALDFPTQMGYEHRAGSRSLNESIRASTR
ncbi:methylmalonyl-CoA mutase family protein [Candidatus Formimonas warabiya]|uniref:methylmalonyl-CoA mutase family protein n=1 Tax=Formimonas warabiya TaxID=1761012 RepID=UPI001F41BA8A|nr:methylmalonyl-CoA mutase family protein [Candidatus Formimonas warabiya]